MSHIKYLSELKPNDSGTIKSIKAEGSLKQKLLDMGMIPGSPIKVLKLAPLGDPIDVQIRGYQLSLRKSEAQHITIEVKCA